MFFGFPGSSDDNHLQWRKSRFDPRVGRSPWRRARQPTPVFLALPGDSAGKESACNVGDLGFIPGLGTSPGEGNGYPVQYSGLENSMDCIVHGVAKESDTTEWVSVSYFQSFSRTKFQKQDFATPKEILSRFTIIVPILQMRKPKFWTNNLSKVVELVNGRDNNLLPICQTLETELR